MKNKGFTIKELIMAIVVIGVLFGLAVPQYYALRNTRENVQTLQKSDPQTEIAQKKNLKSFFRKIFKKK